MSTICILGRQPAIGLAELESLYARVTPLGDAAALVDGEVNFARLGGSVKSAKHLTTLDTTNPQKAFDYCRRTLPEHLGYIPEGKIKLGVSLYGLDMPLAKLNANVLTLKKVIRDTGRSARAIPNTELALSSAQTYHNQLTSPLGLELIMVRAGDRTLLGQVTHVQNINKYTERDRERPRRDTRVGMLPPKLAQIIINLAAGSRQPNFLDTTSEEAKKAIAESSPVGKPVNGRESYSDEVRMQNSSDVLLDPFCGTGVVLQEAALMGFSVYGTDIEERMIRYSRDNLNWLFDTYQVRTDAYYEVADATEHTWRAPVDVVACEGYLGTPFASEPPEAALKDSIATCNLIMKKFLRNIHPQLTPGARLCIAAPAWHVRGRTHHLQMLNELETLGYERLEFKNARTSELIYHREDQIVGRELLVLVRN